MEKVKQNTNNNKSIFLSRSKVSVVFNISSSHANIDLPNRRFLHEHFLITNF